MKWTKDQLGVFFFFFFFMKSVQMAPGCNLTPDSFARWKIKDRSAPLNLKALVIPLLVHYYSPRVSEYKKQCLPMLSITL